MEQKKRNKVGNYLVEHVKCANDLGEIVKEQKTSQLEWLSIFHDLLEHVDCDQVDNDGSRWVFVRVHEQVLVKTGICKHSNPNIDDKKNMKIN